MKSIPTPFTMAEACILAVYFFCLGVVGLVGDSDIAEPTPTTPDRAPSRARRGRARPINARVSSCLIILLVLAQCPGVLAMDADNAVDMGENLVGPVTAVIASGLTATVLTVLPTWDDDDDVDDPIPAPTLSSATATTTPLAATSLPQYEEKESELSDRSYADIRAVQELLRDRSTTLSDVLISPAGQRFSVQSQSQQDYERIALVNTPKLLDDLGKHNKTPVTATLLDGVSMDTVRRPVWSPVSYRMRVRPRCKPRCKPTTCLQLSMQSTPQRSRLIHGRPVACCTGVRPRNSVLDRET
jgi:hypothetical protein